MPRGDEAQGAQQEGNGVERPDDVLHLEHRVFAEWPGLEVETACLCDSGLHREPVNPHEGGEQATDRNGDVDANLQSSTPNLGATKHKTNKSCI